jgi:hypothetical protein
VCACVCVCVWRVFKLFDFLIFLIDNPSLGTISTAIIAVRRLQALLSSIHNIQLIHYQIQSIQMFLAFNVNRYGVLFLVIVGVYFAVTAVVRNNKGGRRHGRI